MLEHLRSLSRYNQRMNNKLYNTAAQLSADELAKDRGAFFGSLLRTLNHIRNKTRETLTYPVDKLR